MKAVAQIRRLGEIHRLVLAGNRGTPTRIAAAIGVSRGHLYNLLGMLKDLGADIGYCRKRETFYYRNVFGLESLMEDMR